MAVIVASFYLRSRIGGRWWRRLHYLSFAVFVLSLLHGLFAGSDTPNLWAQLLYLATAGSLVGLTIYRIRRSLAAGSSAPKLLRAGTLSFDPASRVVTLANNRQVTLRSIEARLLHYLLEHSGQALTVDQILVNIWGQHYLNEPELVAIYIRRLRDRIEHDPSNPHYVRNAQMGAYLVEG
jgi:predicted ferric reductase